MEDSTCMHCNTPILLPAVPQPEDRICSECYLDHLIRKDREQTEPSNVVRLQFGKARAEIATWLPLSQAETLVRSGKEKVAEQRRLDNERVARSNNLPTGSK